MCVISNCNGSQCSRCGECCAMCIPITRKEEKHIREYIKNNNITPENLFTEESMYSSCCFYDRKNKCCKIYPVRPNICRSFKCNRNEEELEKEKIKNHKIAYWNHIGDDGEIKHFTSFDLLFYNDPEPIIQLLYREFCDKNGNMTMESFERMKNMMRKVGLEELAEALHAEE